MLQAEAEPCYDMLCHVVIHPLLFKLMKSSKIALLHLTQ